MLNWKNSYIPKYPPLYAGINCTIKYQVKNLPVHSITLFPLTKNQPLDYFHRHTGYAFIDFSLVFNAIFQHFYFYGVTSVGFSDNATRRGQAVIACPGRDFLNGIFAVVMDGQTGCARKSSGVQISVPQLQVFYRTHREDRPFDPVFYSLVFYIIYI